MVEMSAAWMEQIWVVRTESSTVAWKVSSSVDPRVYSTVGWKVDWRVDLMGCP